MYHNLKCPLMLAHWLQKDKKLATYVLWMKKMNVFKMHNVVKLDVNKIWQSKRYVCIWLVNYFNTITYVLKSFPANKKLVNFIERLVHSLQFWNRPLVVLHRLFFFAMLFLHTCTCTNVGTYVCSYTCCY